jgi:hypothetical protein
MRGQSTRTKQDPTDRTGAGFRWAAAALTSALVLVGCGASDEEPSGAVSTDAASPDSDAPDDDGATTPEGDGGAPATDAETGSDSSGDTAPVAAAGNGTLPADLCAGGVPLSGAITLDDLVGFGILSSSDATVDGAGPLDAIAYNDFGSLCNIEDVNGDFLTIGMSSGAETFESTIEQSGATATQAGEWQYLVSDGLSQLVMLHTDSAGIENTFFVNWFPADDSRRGSDSIAVITPFAEAIVDRSTVDAPMVDALGIPPWFACDDSSPGVAGVDPAALMALVEVPAGIELEIEQDVRASFGNTVCTTRTTARNFPFVRLDVQESDAQLADTLDTYLVSWPDATAETIAGRDVAVRVDTGFGEAFVFTVIDGFPTTVQLGVTTFDGDLGTAVRAAATNFFDAIG